MATDAWYCEVKGEVLGPLTPSEMMRHIRLGDVGFHTRVRKNDSRWVTASEVNGLFEAATKIKEIFRCNYCGNGVARPPSACGHCGQKIDRVTELLKITPTDADRKAAKRPASPAAPSMPAAPTKEQRESRWKRLFKRE